MGEIIFNVVFYLLGLALASIPFILNFKKSELKAKPLWYKISIPTIMVLLTIVGVVKTVIDCNNQSDTITRFNKLNVNIGDVKNSLSVQQNKYDRLLHNLDSIGIKVNNNKPIIVNKTFYTKMRDVGTLNQY